MKPSRNIPRFTYQDRKINSHLTEIMGEQLEEPKFETLAVYDDFEVRKYSPNIQAKVESIKSGDIARSVAFRRIANYIFGSNESNQKIAMTAPVQMWEEGGIEKMSFVMPSEYNLEDLPSPNDAGLSISASQEEIIAALTFKGFSRPGRVRKLSNKLQSLLKNQGYLQTGPMRLAVYDPPTTIPFFRRNEILIPVKQERL